MWTLRSYVHANHRLEVAEWYEFINSKAKAAVRTRLEYLVQQPRECWIRPRFDELHGKAASLGEIILKKVDGVQTRLIGYFDGPQRFTIVTVMTKKGRNTSPRSWEAVSVRRMQEIKAGSAKAHDWVPRRHPR